MYVHVHHTPTLTLNRLETTRPSGKATTGMLHGGRYLCSLQVLLREDALFQKPQSPAFSDVLLPPTTYITTGIHPSRDSSLSATAPLTLLACYPVALSPFYPSTLLPLLPVGLTTRATATTTTNHFQTCHDQYSVLRTPYPYRYPSAALDFWTIISDLSASWLSFFASSISPRSLAPAGQLFILPCKLAITISLHPSTCSISTH